MSISINDFSCEIAGASVTIISVLEDDDIERLTQALAEVGRERIVVLYDPGSIAVARALTREMPPSASLPAWKQRATTLLGAYRRNSHRVVFASATAVTAEPTQFRIQLLRHFNLSGETASIKVPLSAPDWSACEFVLASQALASDANAVLLDRELVAAALPFAPTSYDIDEAFTELQAAASVRAMLIRQLSNLRKEVSEYFLSATAKPGNAPVVEKPDQLGQSAQPQSRTVAQILDVSPAKGAAELKPSRPTIGRIVMNHYLPIVEGDYRHIDISIHEIRDNKMNWEHIRFKFCSWKEHEYIEFRIAPDIPTLFRVWPGQKEDQFGPYLNYPDPFNSEVLNISDPSDRVLLRTIFNILERALDVSLRETNLEEAERSAWLDKARLFVTNQQRITMTAWDAGDK